MFSYPQITGFYAGVLGLLYLMLAIPVVLKRRKYGVGLGEGEQKDLQQAIRVHANFAEYIPLLLIQFMILELMAAHTLVLHGLGIMLVAARCLHAYGLSKSPGTSLGRVAGTALTWTILGITSGWCFAYFVLNI